MKIEQVLYLSEVLGNHTFDDIKVLDRMLRTGGLYDQDYTSERHEALERIVDALNDFRAEGVEDARYWMEQIQRYLEKNQPKLKLKA